MESIRFKNRHVFNLLPRRGQETFVSRAYHNCELCPRHMYYQDVCTSLVFGEEASPKLEQKLCFLNRGDLR